METRMKQLHEIGRRILVPLDGSALAELALPHAAALAAPDANVILFRAVPMPSGEREAVTGNGSQEWTWAAARQELEDAAGRFAMIAPDLSVDVALGAGDPAERIGQFARHHEIDVIVMASFGHGGISQWTFGSVAGQVVRTARIPVLVVRPADANTNDPGRFQRVLVPIDDSARADQSLAIAGGLAQRLDVPVHLVSVIDPVQVGFPRQAGGLIDDVWQQVWHSLAASAQQTLVHVAATLTQEGVTADWQLVQGATVSCLREASRPGDLIVITSHAGDQVSPWQSESVGEQLVRTAGVPVMLNRFVLPPEVVVPVHAEVRPPERPDQFRPDVVVSAL